MRNRFILLSCVLMIALGVVAVPFPQGAAAIALVFAVSIPLLFLFRRSTDEKEFITTIFLGALAVNGLDPISPKVGSIKTNHRAVQPGT